MPRVWRRESRCGVVAQSCAEREDARPRVRGWHGTGERRGRRTRGEEGGAALEARASAGEVQSRAAQWPCASRPADVRSRGAVPVCAVIGGVRQGRFGRAVVWGSASEQGEVCWGREGGASARVREGGRISGAAGDVERSEGSEGTGGKLGERRRATASSAGQRRGSLEAHGGGEELSSTKQGTPPAGAARRLSAAGRRSAAARPARDSSAPALAPQASSAERAPLQRAAAIPMDGRTHRGQLQRCRSRSEHLTQHSICVCQMQDTKKAQGRPEFEQAAAEAAIVAALPSRAGPRVLAASCRLGRAAAVPGAASLPSVVDCGCRAPSRSAVAWARRTRRRWLLCPTSSAMVQGAAAGEAPLRCLLRRASTPSPRPRAPVGAPRHE